MEKRVDRFGRHIWGSGPDRTCLDCYVGFSLDLLSKEGLSPCCSSFRHVSAIWNDPVIIPPKEVFSVPEGEGLWAKLDREYEYKKTIYLSDFKEALYNFFKYKSDGK